MIGTTRIQGADLYKDNVNGNNWVPMLQVSTGQRSKLHKVVVSNLTTDAYLWVFDLAAGSGASAAPRMVCLCPGGVCTTLDLTDGTPFYNGIFLALSTTQPTDATTAPTLSANNAGIIDASYRME